MKGLSYLLPIVVLFVFSCKKHTEEPCAGKTQPVAEFRMSEVVGDTTFTADTIFRDNFVDFESLTNYQWQKWNIGNDPREFTQSNFNLTFINVLETITVNFTAYKNPDAICFPLDNGIYRGQKQFTVVEQFEKPILTLSPLLGRYHGYFTDNPADTFTVRVEYFDSTKYDVGLTGLKNFYWISNIPKGFNNTSTPAFVYPELRNGLGPEMGYKSFVFDYNTCISGKGWLTNDTLMINYGNDFCGRKKFIGKRFF